MDMTAPDRPPGGGITYVEFLVREIQDRLEGVWTCCGPEIIDYPTLRERISHNRPNYQVEKRLEAQLETVERQMEQERELAL
jgi:hypothetical protein